jgi:DNA-binding NarL/FixJ family response regulator
VRVIRVAVADDDAAFRRALVDVLAAHPQFEVVVQAASGEDLGELVLRGRADLVLVDVRMPLGGPVAARAVRDAAGAGRPAVVVALSADSAAQTVVSMVRAGAVGYLLKGRIGAALPDLLSRCMNGEVVLSTPSAAVALRELAAAASVVPATPGVPPVRGGGPA